MNKETFKAGDEVYCPYLSRKVYKLDNLGVQAYPLTIEKNVSFTTYGKISVNHLQPDLFHATPENKQLLEALYKCEFESPKLKGSDLTRKLLSEGKLLLCRVSDASDESALLGKSVAIVSCVNAVNAKFVSASTLHWNFAVPCNDYANLVDGVLEVKK